MDNSLNNQPEGGHAGEAAGASDGPELFIFMFVLKK